MLKDVLFNQAFPELKQGMDVTALRQKLFADNVANVATPGYQSRHVAFEELLRGRSPAHQLGLAAPESGAAFPATGRPSVAPRVLVDTSPDLRSGVNNVDIEREMAGLQKNNLIHAAMTQLVSARYKMMREAIMDRSA